MNTLNREDANNILFKIVLFFIFSMTFISPIRVKAAVVETKSIRWSYGDEKTAKFGSYYFWVNDMKNPDAAYYGKSANGNGKKFASFVLSAVAVKGDRAYFATATNTYAGYKEPILYSIDLKSGKKKR